MELKSLFTHLSLRTFQPKDAPPQGQGASQIGRRVYAGVFPVVSRNETPRLLSMLRSEPVMPSTDRPSHSPLKTTRATETRRCRLSGAQPARPGARRPASLRPASDLQGGPLSPAAGGGPPPRPAARPRPAPAALAPPAPGRPLRPRPRPGPGPPLGTSRG